MHTLEHEKRSRAVVDGALATLRELGLLVDWRAAPVGSEVDGHLTVRWQGTRAKFPVEVRSLVRPGLLTMAGPPRTPRVLFTGHVTPGSAQVLEKLDWLGYVDVAGNVSLSASG